MNYIDATLAINEGSKAPDYAAGPQWAIFDAATVKRKRMLIRDISGDPELFFVADMLEELVKKISTCPYQHCDMDGKVLAETVKRYNDFVEKGADEDFDKPTPEHVIKQGPFYAAWTTFVVHDSYTGLRINGDCQLMDMKGRVIEGLWWSDESAGGYSQHGLGRCLTQGYIIGQRLAALK